MAKEGLPFVLVPALIAMLLAYFQLWIFAAVFAAIALFMAYFFRDPYRESPEGEGLIVAGADGTVTRIDETDEGKLVSVFMSPLDVHINRSPIAGKVTKAEYIRGKKAPATSNTASFTNERNSLTITGEQFTVRCTQIAGIMARRIVCWSKEGDELKRGQKFGLIKFSSRTDVLMPSNTELMVKIGDHVKGGETILGRVI
ncbi:MAG: phosphatidylserine decarboxylase [Pyrinomonadaceae bacterium]|nr:phosphatidylserine decarboxylase [Blastocatellia bacterium]MCW5958112.1 phosphatidylserine decarboxylase [Pyrinomonadaceae bacterium]